MANEDKKDFNAMLHKKTDMPKIKIVTDEAVIKRYGGEKMYFAPAITYDEIMKKIPYGKIITTAEIREYLAKKKSCRFYRTTDSRNIYFNCCMGKSSTL